MNREEIKRILPHREPMLLVDEVTVDEQEIAHGVYTVRGDEWFVQGHFPGNPVVPGVVLCEMMGQTSCALLGDKLIGKTPLFTGMDKVKFKHSARPGDTLLLTCRITRNNGPFFIIEGAAHIGDELCAQGTFTFALISNS